MPRFVPGRQIVVQRFVLGRQLLYHSFVFCKNSVVSCWVLLGYVWVCLGLFGSNNIQLGLVRTGCVLLGVIVSA